MLENIILIKSVQLYTCSKWLFLFLTESLSFQKQLSRGVLRKSFLKICSWFTGEHSYYSVILKKLLCNFIEIPLRHGYSPVNLLHIFRTPFPKSTSGGLLLNRINYLCQQVMNSSAWHLVFVLHISQSLFSFSQHIFNNLLH